MYNLYSIVKEIIKSTSPKEYIKKIMKKKFVHGYYLISKEDLIEIINKSKSQESKDFLQKINQNEKTGYELTEEELNIKYETNQINNYDIGTQLINFEKSKIRYLYDENGNIYFRAKDLCVALEYTNTNQAISINVDKSYVFNFKSLMTSISHSINGIECTDDEKTIYINEAGLYSLIFKSTKDNAKIFSKWVFEEVLPSIRKYGFYKINKKFNLNQYENKNCFYIFKGVQPFYKYGITTDIKQRISSHKADGLLENENHLCDIFVIENFNDLMQIENKLKEYIKLSGSTYIYETYTELFKESEYNRVLGKLKELISEINIKREIQNEKIYGDKKVEILKLEKEKLQLSLDLKDQKHPLNEIKEIINQLKNETNTKFDFLKDKISKIEYDIHQIKNEFLKNKKVKPNKPNKPDKLEKPVKPDKPDNKCSDCNTKIAPKSQRCAFCENKKRFFSNKGKRPSYQELKMDKEKLKSNVKIGKKYGVSDVAVRKWFKGYETYCENF